MLWQDSLLREMVFSIWFCGLGIQFFYRRDLKRSRANMLEVAVFPCSVMMTCALSIIARALLPCRSIFVRFSLFPLLSMLSCVTVFLVYVHLLLLPLITTITEGELLAYFASVARSGLRASRDVVGVQGYGELTSRRVISSSRLRNFVKATTSSWLVTQPSRPPLMESFMHPQRFLQSNALAGTSNAVILCSRRWRGEL